MSELDEQFPPRPGGMVDSARKASAAVAESAPPEAAAADFDGSRYDPVKVQLRVPEVATAGTLVVGTAAVAVKRLVGEDGQRCRLTITALDEDVVITFSRTAADDPRNAGTEAGVSAGGYVLAAGTSTAPAVPLVLETVSEVWVTATSSTAGRVSFIRQSFAG